MAKTKVDVVVETQSTSEREIDTLSFSTVLEMLKVGMAAKRLGWNGKTQHIEIQNYGFSSPVIVIVDHTNEIRMPWLASQQDLISEDWEVFAKPEDPNMTNLAGMMNSNDRSQKETITLKKKR